MPDRMHMLDTGYPNFSGYEKTSEKVDAIQNYLFILLEELRFLLRNLDLDNFNEQGIKDLATAIAGILPKDAEFERVIADAVIADALYAELAEINDLTVERLSTSRRIRKYLLGDLSDDNYIKIQDHYQQLITGTVKSTAFLATEDGDPILTEYDERITLEAGQVPTTQALNYRGEGLYWQKEPASHTEDGYPLDEEGKRTYASTKVTGWPVLVYEYIDLVKAQLAFERGGLANNYLPKMVFGAGDENGNSKGYIFKDETAFYLRYVSKLAKNVDVVFSDDGFVDAMHRRLKSCNIDPDTGTVTYKVEGSDSLHSLAFSVSGDTVTYRWPDGYTCTVTIPEDEEDE